MSTVTKLPAWKQAVDDFLALNAPLGHLLTKEWLVAAFGLSAPTTLEAQRQFDFDYLAGIDSFRRELLEKHCMAFKTERGEGLRLLTAQEQVDYAIEERDRQIGKALRFGARTLMYLRSNELTTDERANHADQLARHAGLASVIKRTRSLPSAFKALLTHKDEGPSE